MPFMDGPEFLLKVRKKKKKLGKIPCILYSNGYDSDLIFRVGRKVKLDNYISKPFDHQDLGERIRPLEKKFK